MVDDVGQQQDFVFQLDLIPGDPGDVQQVINQSAELSRLPTHDFRRTTWSARRQNACRAISSAAVRIGARGLRNFVSQHGQETHPCVGRRCATVRAQGRASVASKPSTKMPVTLPSASLMGW
jgi:hypothetical protein